MVRTSLRRWTLHLRVDTSLDVQRLLLFLCLRVQFQRDKTHFSQFRKAEVHNTTVLLKLGEGEGFLADHHGSCCQQRSGTQFKGSMYVFAPCNKEKPLSKCKSDRLKNTNEISSIFSAGPKFCLTAESFWCTHLATYFVLRLRSLRDLGISAIYGKSESRRQSTGWTDWIQVSPSHQPSRGTSQQVGLLLYAVM